MKSVMRVSKRGAQGVNPNLVLKGEEATGGDGSEAGTPGVREACQGQGESRILAYALLE